MTQPPTTKRPEDADAATPRTAPNDAQGPLHIVMNARSGHADSDDVRAKLEALLQQSGRDHHFHFVDDGGQVEQAARDAAQAAVADGGVVVAVGGDGTLSTVAHAVLPTGRPMGVIPQGTFNYFGRAYGAPEDPEEAMHAVLAGHVEPVQVGRVNGRVFLVSASVGMYPQLIEDREAWKARFGRSRFVALAAGLRTLLSAHRHLTLELDGEAGATRLRTITLVVVNNALQLEQLGLDEAPVVQQGRLAFITVKPVTTWTMLGLVVRGAMGKLGDARAVRVQAARRVRVRARDWLHRRIKVAIDGELLMLKLPLDIEVPDQPLLLIRPTAVAAENGGHSQDEGAVPTEPAQ